MIEDNAEVERRGQEAVARLIAELDEGAMATRFVLLIEVIGPDGRRAAWQVTAADQRVWDTLGLLDHARATEYVAMVRDAE